MDNTGWRVNGVNHFRWDFITPGINAALFVVDRSGGHQVPEQVLAGNPEHTMVCDGGMCVNPLKGKKRIQRDWVHIRRHAKEGLRGYEMISDAPDWRWLKSAKTAADAVLKTAKLPKGKERDRRVAEVRRRVEHLPAREVEGEPARKLRKYLLELGSELWTWVGTGGLAQSNAAEQGLRFHIAGKRKVSCGGAGLRWGRLVRRRWRACRRRHGCGRAGSRRWASDCCGETGTRSSWGQDPRVPRVHRAVEPTL